MIYHTIFDGPVEVPDGLTYPQIVDDPALSERLSNAQVAALAEAFSRDPVTGKFFLDASTGASDVPADP